MLLFLISNILSPNNQIFRCLKSQELLAMRKRIYPTQILSRKASNIEGQHLVKRSQLSNPSTLVTILIRRAPKMRIKKFNKINFLNLNSKSIQSLNNKTKICPMMSNNSMIHAQVLLVDYLRRKKGRDSLSSKPFKGSSICGHPELSKLNKCPNKAHLKCQPPKIKICLKLSHKAFSKALKVTAASILIPLLKEN